MTAAPLFMTPVWVSGHVRRISRPGGHAVLRSVDTVACPSTSAVGHPLDWAAVRARLRRALPAVNAEHPGHLRGGRARLVPDIGPVVPERLLPLDGGGVIPRLVPPPILDRMSYLPIQLDHHRVLLIHSVPAS